jgi:hypothetical protein
MIFTISHAISDKDKEIQRKIGLDKKRRKNQESTKEGKKFGARFGAAPNSPKQDDHLPSQSHLLYLIYLLSSTAPSSFSSSFLLKNELSRNARQR